METYWKLILVLVFVTILLFTLLAPTQLVVAVLSRIFWFAKRLVFASIGASAFALFFAILNPQLGFVIWIVYTSLVLVWIGIAFILNAFGVWHRFVKWMSL